MEEGFVERTDPATEYFFEEGCHILELSNSDRDPGASVARARVPVGGVTRWHCLEGITERYILLEGTGQVEIGVSMREDLGPGDVAVIPPGVRQRVSNTGSGDLLFLAVCTPRFNSEAYQDLEEMILAEADAGDMGGS